MGLGGVWSLEHRSGLREAGVGRQGLAVREARASGRWPRRRPLAELRDGPDGAAEARDDGLARGLGPRLWRLARVAGREVPAARK